jgi:hypothetical protein
MDIQDIHKTIVTLTNLYSELNEYWETDKCIVGTFQVLRQEKYKGYYETLNESDIENLTLNIISNSLNKNILNRLQILIEQNILIYKQHQHKFDGLDFYALYEVDEHDTFDGRLAILLKDKEDIQNFEYPTEQEKTMLLKENQEEINLLKAEKSNYRRKTAWIIENYYSKIYELSQSFSSILNIYFPVEKEKTQKEVKPTIKPGLYFDMQLVSLIHHQCNNIQFENLSEIDLYTLLNLQPTNAKLIIKPNEQVRMCYLVYKLYKYLKTDSRTEWRTLILKSAGIKEQYYQSKYKEPTSKMPTQKSESFAQNMDEIFDNIS